MSKSCPNSQASHQRGRRIANLCLLLGVVLPLTSPHADVTVDTIAGDRKPVSTFVPKYPQKALEQRLEGEVTVCFFVAEDGKVERARVRKSSHRIFEKPVLRAMRASAFEPLAEGERVSPAKTCRTFYFRLESVGEKAPDD